VHIYPKGEGRVSSFTEFHSEKCYQLFGKGYWIMLKSILYVLMAITYLSSKNKCLFPSLGLLMVRPIFF
jgi:hypothetical protein